MNNDIYLRRKCKVHVREGQGGATRAQLATVQKELAALGYVCAEPLLERLGTLSIEGLTRFLRDLLDGLRKQLGAHRQHQPLYPGFPREVLAASDAELYLNALAHYLTLRRRPPTDDERPALLDGRAPRVIELGTKEEFDGLFTKLAASRTSLSVADVEDLTWFIRQYRADVFRLMPPEVPFKENRAVIGAALVQHVVDPRVDAFLDANVDTATDVLRLAVALSGCDVSLAIPSKFAKTPRSRRRLLLGLLDRASNAVEDVMRYAEPWKRLAEVLHPGDFAEKFPNAWSAIQAARIGKAPPSFNACVEAALEQRELQRAAAMLVDRPGELARRLDVLLRRDSDSGAVIEQFAGVAPRVSTPVLLQVLTHFRAPRPLPLRAFTPKGELAKVFAIKDERPTIEPGVRARVAEVCERALMERFSKRPPLGRCFVEESLSDFMAPLVQRSASKSLRTVTRGSRLPLPDTRFIRLFLWWKNGRSRTDIDLSVAFYDCDFVYSGIVSYYNLKSYGGYHSGDIVDAPQGASEFIDLDLSKLADKGVRYVVTSLNSYTAQPYCDLPECFTGWMARSDLNSGEVYEPRTVVDRIDVGAATSICLPMVIDIEQRRVVWADIGLTARVGWNNTHNNLSGVSLMLRSIIHTPRPDLGTLFRLHAQARGQLAPSKAEADTVFGVHEGLTPFDVDTIRADYL
ncbi:MAG TPA: TerD family protein [Ideonella sp.]|uniref:TerD family protein n=1 Tax=Ideonella sp. TaxID=1929293 RepID=UPI002E32B400|nr:TerD family protein [Ideonella sp.]HEX5682743.1 TerD family protein [Ideonella sp.]